MQINCNNNAMIMQINCRNSAIIIQINLSIAVEKNQKIQRFMFKKIDGIQFRFDLFIH